MRSNEEFKAEVIKRSNVYRKKKKRIIASCACFAVCLMIFSGLALMPSLTKYSGGVDIVSSHTEKGSYGKDLNNFENEEYYTSKSDNESDNYSAGSSGKSSDKLPAAENLKKFEYNAENIAKIEISYKLGENETVYRYASKEKLEKATQLINSLPLDSLEESSVPPEYDKAVDDEKCTITVTNADGNEDIYVLSGLPQKVEIFISEVSSD